MAPLYANTRIHTDLSNLITYRFGAPSHFGAPIQQKHVWPNIFGANVISPAYVCLAAGVSIIGGSEQRAAPRRDFLQRLPVWNAGGEGRQFPSSPRAPETLGTPLTRTFLTIRATLVQEIGKRCVVSPKWIEPQEDKSSIDLCISSLKNRIWIQYQWQNHVATAEDVSNSPK